MLRSRGVAVLALLLASLLACHASAATVYSDFDTNNNNAYNTFHGWIISGSSYSGGLYVGLYEDAMPFTPTADFTFVSADVGAFLESGPNSITLTLAANDSGLPGAAIESLTVSGTMQKLVSTILEADSVDHPALKSGVKYWLVVSASGNTAAVWNYNSIGFTGDWLKHGAQAWTHDTTSATGAFAINGTKIVPTPEPASIVMFATGALAVVGFGAAYRRRAGKHAA
jgi:hypothetical protein